MGLFRLLKHAAIKIISGLFVLAFAAAVVAMCLGIMAGLSGVLAVAMPLPVLGAACALKYGSRAFKAIGTKTGNGLRKIFKMPGKPSKKMVSARKDEYAPPVGENKKSIFYTPPAPPPTPAFNQQRGRGNQNFANNPANPNNPNNPNNINNPAFGGN